MSLARRMMASSSLGTLPGQAEYTSPGTYNVVVPAGVTSFCGVAIAAGLKGTNLNPFNGAAAGNLHWRNEVACTPGELLTIVVGRGDTTSAVNAESSIKRSSTYLLRASNSSGNISGLYHPTLGGGGGAGGSPGSGSPGNGGLGGGGPGYEGKGGTGGNIYDTANGQMPEVNSGGGRGGDANGVPYGWSSQRGEGTGLLGRSPDFSTSLGAVRCGGGDWAAGSGGLDGGVRIIWGGGRAYPDNVPDLASSVVATPISTSNGSVSGSSPIVFTFHTDAVEGDLLVFWPVLAGSGSSGSFTGISNMHQAGVVYWKQITAADIAASIAGTTQFSGSGTRGWVTQTYRGPRVAVQRAVAPSFPVTDTVTIPGVTKRIDCKRLVVTSSDADAGATNDTPAGFTSRANRTTPLKMRLSDIAPASYADGSDIILTGMVATAGTSAYLIELC